MTTSDRPNFLSTPFLFPGMIVSISHSRILGLSFFSFPSCSWISGVDFFVPLLCPNFGKVVFHSPLVLGLWEWNYAFPLTLGMTSINTFPPLRAHLYSQKCYGKLEKSKDRFLFPYFSLSYPLDKCQRRRLLILNSVKCEMCRTYSPNMSEQGWRAIFKRGARDLGTFASDSEPRLSQRSPFPCLKLKLV